MAKQNVRGELNALKIGEWANFPLDRYEYTLSCRTKLQGSTNKIFTSLKQKEVGRVYYQRIA